MPGLIKSHVQFPSRQQSGGYVLIIVVLLLAGLFVISMQFFDRSILAMRSADLNRASNESLLLAESAVNWLYGSFINNGTIDGTRIDNTIPITVINPSLSASPYIFYINENNAQPPEIRIGNPDILQRIADGEASQQGGTINGQIVESTAQTLLITNLLSNNNQKRAILFERSNGGFTVNMNINWLSNNNPRAAAWIELVRDPDQPNIVLVYVESVGRFDNSQSYIQRLLGYYDNTLSTGIVPITQSGLMRSNR